MAINSSSDSPLRRTRILNDGRPSCSFPTWEIVEREDGGLELLATRKLIPFKVGPVVVFLIFVLVTFSTLWLFGSTAKTIVFSILIMLIGLCTTLGLVMIQLLPIWSENNRGIKILSISPDGDLHLPRDDYHYSSNRKVAIELTTDYLPGEYVRRHGGGRFRCSELNLRVSTPDGERVHGLVGSGPLEEAANRLAKRTGWRIEKFVETGHPPNNSKILPRDLPNQQTRPDSR